MTEIIQIDVADGQSITALYQHPAEPSTTRLDQTLIVMAHGFPGNKDEHGHIFRDIEFLMTTKSYHTLRFDFRGCGESDGHQGEFTLAQACVDFQAVMGWARGAGYTRFFFIGAGLGAAVAAMNLDKDVRALMMFWPVLDCPLYCRVTLGIEDEADSALRRDVITKGGQEIGAGLVRALKKTDLRPVLKEIFVPTMIFHGARDASMPVQQLDLARRYIPAKRLEITIFQDGEHGLPQSNHRHALMFQLQQFIDRYI